ncbi:MAG: hypothetical protein AB7E59_05700 [Pusillimonas sp.]
MNVDIALQVKEACIQLQQRSAAKLQQNNFSESKKATRLKAA